MNDLQSYKYPEFNEDFEGMIPSGESDGGSSLPDVTASDNGKVLSVVNGRWVASAPNGKSSLVLRGYANLQNVSMEDWNFKEWIKENTVPITASQFSETERVDVIQCPGNKDDYYDTVSDAINLYAIGEDSVPCWFELHIMDNSKGEVVCTLPLSYVADYDGAVFSGMCNSIGHLVSVSVSSSGGSNYATLQFYPYAYGDPSNA